MNAASTIIQSAAHEDANIIFGAVLDESMGDEVKITVIATGFRAETPQRRERMLGLADDSLEMTQPVIHVGTMPPFASQVGSQPRDVYHEPAWAPRQINAPVVTEPAYEGMTGTETSGEDDNDDDIVRYDEAELLQAASHQPEARVQQGAGRSHEPEMTAENIDIPAFLRRGGL